jgi:hypothetical protein
MVFQFMSSPTPLTQFYQVSQNLNLYDSAKLEKLATQAAAGRYLRYLDVPSAAPTQVCLYEDDYPGWLNPQDQQALVPILGVPAPSPDLSPAQIQALVPAILEFCQQAMQQTNFYLWGGTYGPNYDCSGLMQASFASQGIWLPRDAYQQEAFCQSIAPGLPVDEVVLLLLPGDLIFFGTPNKATHVGIHLGSGRYLHSSGQAQGRDGMGIDDLTPTGDPVTMAYLAQFRGAGRVIQSYRPRYSADALGKSR